MPVCNKHRVPFFTRFNSVLSNHPKSMDSVSSVMQTSRGFWCRESSTSIRSPKRRRSRARKKSLNRHQKFGGRFRCDADGPTPPQELDVEPKSQTYRGLVVLQGEVVKDDSGSYAVFTEQGSSASHMTAAKVLDVMARVLGCAGQPSDAVSAHIQLRRGGAPNLLKRTQSACPDIRNGYEDTSGRKTWHSIQ